MTRLTLVHVENSEYRFDRNRPIAHILPAEIASIHCGASDVGFLRKPWFEKPSCFPPSTSPGPCSRRHFTTNGHTSRDWAYDLTSQPSARRHQRKSRSRKDSYAWETSQRRRRCWVNTRKPSHRAQPVHHERLSRPRHGTTDRQAWPGVGGSAGQ
jgi:hypothetical protein